jgi:hypothetical protein
MCIVALFSSCILLSYLSRCIRARIEEKKEQRGNILTDGYLLSLLFALVCVKRPGAVLN